MIVVVILLSQFSHVIAVVVAVIVDVNVQWQPGLCVFQTDIKIKFSKIYRYQLIWNNNVNHMSSESSSYIVAVCYFCPRPTLHLALV